MSLRLRTRVVAAVGVVVALSGLPSALDVPAAAPQLAGCHSSGPALRYVVLFAASTPGSDTTGAIRAACGTSTAYYPEIGVAVATSTEPGFAAQLGLDRAYSAQAEAPAAARSAGSVVRPNPD
ncbi:MAG: serine protease, partial [Pseudonocardiaceae bacterium]